MICRHEFLSFFSLCVAAPPPLEKGGRKKGASHASTERRGKSFLVSQKEWRKNRSQTNANEPQKSGRGRGNGSSDEIALLHFPPPRLGITIPPTSFGRGMSFIFFPGGGGWRVRRRLLISRIYISAETLSFPHLEIGYHDFAVTRRGRDG